MMRLTGRREHHPALMMYLLTLLLLCLCILLGFISLFVPWVQKDVAIGNRVFSYPFKTCYAQTFSPVHQQTCMDNDFIVGPKGAPLTGGNDTCKLFLIVAIALGFTGIIGGWVLLHPLLFVVWRLWSRPIWLASVCQFFLVMVPCCTTVSWSVFIAYAEMTCHAKSIFPVQGYSYGFILLVFATALAMGAVVTGFLALIRLKRYQVLDLDAKEKELYVEGQPVQFDGVYEEPPQVAPTPVPSSDPHTPVVVLY